MERIGKDGKVWEGKGKGNERTEKVKKGWKG